MKRLFVGIPVSEEIKVTLQPVVDQLRQTGADLTMVAMDKPHFTLKFLGDVSEKEISFVLEKLETITVPKFTLSVAGVGVFPSLERINVIWIGTKSKDLIVLMKKITEQLNDIKKEEREEMPHLTLARVKSGRNKELLWEVIKKWENHDFGKMLADKFVLYESTLKPEGPIYNVVKKFKLN